MSDIMPDYLVEIQRLKHQLARLKQQVEGYNLEILEARSRAGRARENRTLTEKSIMETEANLASLIEAHGNPEVDDNV